MQATPLIELPALARSARVARVFVKNEGARPLGNFKVLGGMQAGLRALAKVAGTTSPPRLLCASDGNHGLAVACAAEQSGAAASIYLPAGVNRVRAERIAARGAQIVWVRGTYDDAVREASAAAARGDGVLIADTSTDPHDRVVRDVMSGYGLLTDELTTQFHDEVRTRPSHMFIQAGVGGLAAIMAERFRHRLLDPRRLVIVEPASADCVAQALRAGRPVRIQGELQTVAEMLSCGLASAAAVEILLRHDVRSITVDEDELQAAVSLLCSADGPSTTPSGAAGLAGLLSAAASTQRRAEHRLDADSNVLLVVTESGAGLTRDPLD